ncbi:MAG TPA: MarR family transcriptional regulator [Acidimicrobiales bacterium]|jgi:DNA-binding MarR family transcriptional regulator|nr:MarR family transcriptional regulator [Acidimicrobiales bacterium]
MTTAAAPSTVDLLFLLNQASHALQTHLTAALAEEEVTPRDHCVLAKAMLGEYTQGQLAAMAALDKTTMVVTLDHLEKAGLAERRPSSTDRRARIVAVTDKGRALVERTQGIVDGTFDETLAHLPEEERGAFVDALMRLVEGPLAAPSHTARPVRRRAQR